MKIFDIQAYPLQIPLNILFAQSSNQASHSSSVIIRMISDKGVEGYGECCPRPYVTGEDIESVLEDVGRLRSFKNTLAFDSFAEIGDWMWKVAQVKFGQSTLCAIEMALLDIWSKEERRPLEEEFGCQKRDLFEYTAVIPFGDASKMKTILEDFHFKRAKIKVGDSISASLKRIALVKELFGKETEVQVDVNGGWTLQEACLQLPDLINVGVNCIEQPFPPDKDEQMGWLTWKYGKEIHIMADESVCTYSQASFLLENKFCNRFNLKLSKNGGIFSALRIAKLAEKHGVPVQLGAHVGETSLLTAAGMLFTSVCQGCLSMEGGMGTYLLNYDVVENPLMINRFGQISMAEKGLSLGWGPVLADRLQGIALS